MITSSSHEVTRLLQAYNAGDPTAYEQLMPLLYQELYRLARGYMRRERANHTLQPTSLVNEAYLRLAGDRQVEWQNRKHFFAHTAKIMRNILVDLARSKEGKKIKITLDEAINAPDSGGELIDFLALDAALKTLAELDPEACEVVILHFFGGLTEAETAELLNLSLDMVKRRWKKARLWLYRELSQGHEDDA